MRQSTSIPLVLAAALCFLAAVGCGDDLKPGDPGRGRKLVLSKCTFCHYVEGQGGMIAPPLEKGLALAATLVRDYEKRIADLKQSNPKAYESAKPQIDAVLAEKDFARRYELWLAAYLRDTKFDNPMTKMGNVLLSPQEHDDVVAWLIAQRPD